MAPPIPPLTLETVHGSGANCGDSSPLEPISTASRQMGTDLSPACISPQPNLSESPPRYPGPTRARISASEVDNGEFV